MSRKHGLLAAYRKRNTHGQRQLSWEAYSHAYLAELDSLPTKQVLDLVQGLCDMPCRYTTVTLLGCEHAPVADERRVRCHRRLLRAWLLGTTDLLPLALHMPGHGRALSPN